MAQQRGNLGGAGGQEAEEQPSSTFLLSHQWNQHKCGSGASKIFPVTHLMISCTKHIIKEVYINDQCKGSGITHNFIYHFCNVY